jgi:hypothetical protein
VHVNYAMGDPLYGVLDVANRRRKVRTALQY